MGAYLSQPLTEKHSEDGDGNNVKFGGSCMQGWRVSQEDAHNCVVNFDVKSSLFAVYDGHGGAEVAVFLSHHFPDFLKGTEGYKNGDMTKALHECFVEIDKYVKSEKGLTEIGELAQAAKGSDKEECSIVEEDISALKEEALMPIEAVYEKYKSTPMFPQLTEVEDGKEKPGSSKGLLPGISKVSETAEVVCSSTSMNTFVVPSEEAKAATGSSEPECISTPSELENTDLDRKPLEDEKREVLEITTDKTEEPEPSEPAKEKMNGCVEETKVVQNGVSKDNADIEAEIEKSSDQVKSVNSILVNGQADAAAVREESILVEPSPTKVRKGKTHPPIPVPVATSDRKLKVKDRKIYEEFKSESGTSDSEDCEDESYVGIGDEMDSDDSGESEAGGLENSDDTSEADGDDGEEEESEDDEDDEVDDEEDDEGLLSDVQEPGFDSGCTAVVAFLKWQIDTGLLDLWVANAGDSRCIFSRGGTAVEMSEDHKPENDTETKRIVNAGGKVSTDGRVNGGLNLSRAIGDHSYKQNQNLPLEEQMITPVPDIRHEILDPSQDDFIVLACDGVWNSMSSQDVVDFVAEKLTNENTLSGICEQLFDKCLAVDTSGDGTGCDNMTAVIIKIGPNECAKGSGKRLRNSPSPPPPDDRKKMRVDVELTD